MVSKKGIPLYYVKRKYRRRIALVIIGLVIVIITYV